jgi:hypothetical protein
VAAENTNFLKIVNDTTIDLVTSFRYSPGKCCMIQYKTINRFSANDMKWQNETFFPEKYEQLHGCPVHVGHRPNPSVNISIAIIENLARPLNFSHVTFKLTNPLEINEFDFVSFISVLDINAFTQDIETTPSLHADFLTFTVPAGQPYTQFQKMFLMFDKETWICIGLTIALNAQLTSDVEKR